MSLRKLSMLLVFVTCGLFCASTAKADPLFFSNVTLNIAGVTPMGGTDLFSNPGLVITTNPDGVVVIQIHIDGSGTGTLRTSGTATNENGTINLPTIDQASLPNQAKFMTLNPSNYPLSFQGTTISLTVDLLNTSPDFIIPSGPNQGQQVDSYTYNFTLVQPVPEPTTFVLLTTGVAGIAARLYKRKKLK